MATYQRNWGQAANTNNNGYGSGANNDIGWGSVHKDSYGHDETDLVGVPAIYVGNPDSPTGIGDPTNGTSTLLYRNRIEARPLWDATGTQLNDYSASNNGGQIHSGGALSFDGVNDYVQTDVFIDGPFTFSAFVDRRGFTDSLSIISTEGVSNSFGARIGNASDSGNNGLVDIRVQGTVVYGVTKLTDNQAEVVGTWDGETISLYVDGVLENSAPYNGPLTANTKAQLMTFPYAGPAYRAGTLKDVKIYSRALSESEVLQNYNNPQQPVTNGLEVWYDFNELDGLTLFDRSGNDYNASINGATWESGTKEGYQPALGGFNNYEVFDGVDDYIAISQIDLSGDFAITFVGSISDLASVQINLLGRFSSSNERLQLLPASNLINFRASGGTIHTFSFANWTTSKTKYEVKRTGTTVEIFVNESSIGTVTDSGTFRFDAIGTFNSGSYYQGIIDYVEVEGVGRWSNLGGWVDEIGSNDGTVSGSPTTARIAGPTYDATTDIFGNEILNPFIPSALNFSGGYSGLYVDAGANVDTATDFSYAGWHYLDGGSSTFDILYANRTNGLGQELAALNVVTGSTYELRFRNDDGLNNDVTTTTDLNYGTWHFVAACYTTAGAVNIYVGTKDTAPTRYGNGNFSAPAAGSLNMAFTNRPDGSVSFGGYELYEVMFAENLSSANTDLTKINQIWQSTKSLIPDS